MQILKVIANRYNQTGRAIMVPELLAEIGEEPAAVSGSIRCLDSGGYIEAATQWNGDFYAVKRITAEGLRASGIWPGTSRRPDSVARAFLRWLGEHDAENPQRERFLEDPASAVNGEQVTEEELAQVVARLYSRRLIAGAMVNEDPLPVCVNLTDTGRLVLFDYGGDLAAWRDDQRMSIDSSTRVTGNNIQVAAHSSNVTQFQSGAPVDVEKLVDLARVVLEQLPTMDLPASQEMDIRGAAEEALVEARGSQPDHSRLRALIERMRSPLGTLGTGAAGSALGKFLYDALTALL